MINEEDLKNEFNKEDEENTGFTSKDNILKILEVMQMNNDIIEKILSELTVEDNKVSYDVFYEVMKNNVKIEDVDSIEKIQD